MLFDELAAEAFARGCGVTLASACRSSAFQALYDQAAALDLPYPRHSALAEYLGGRLADRAFCNLPPPLRQEADAWQSLDVSGQMAVLERICTELRSDRWYALGSSRLQVAQVYNSTAENVLPHAYKSWRRGRVVPNCLGIAQMLVGFARAARVPHYLINVVLTAEQYLLQCEAKALSMALEIVERLTFRSPAMHEAVTSLRKGYEQALSLLDARFNTQAHHTLLIQLNDGQWWVVDPYLNALYELKAPADFAVPLEVLQTKRNRVLSITEMSAVPAYERELECRLTALQFMGALITAKFRADDPVFRDRYILPHLAFASVLSAQEGGLPDDRRLFQQFMEVPHDIVEQADSHPLGAPLANLLYACVMHGRDLSDDIAASAIDHSRQDPAVQERFAWRIVARHLLDLLHFIDGAYKLRRNRVHASVEIAQPSLMLGVATLNHLRHYMPAQLGGVLATLSSSQWVTADTLAYAQRGDALDELSQSLLDQRLAVLLGAERPYGLVPPLQTQWYARRGV